MVSTVRKSFDLSKVVFGAQLLTLAAASLYALERGHRSTPAPHTERVIVQQPIAFLPEDRPLKSVAQRKRDITEYLAGKYRVSAKSVRTYVDLAWQESARNPDVPPELILAVIQKESSLSPTATSGYGAEGLMQVVRRMHPEKLGRKESLFDPGVNIRVGAEILQQYIEDKGVEPALVKYSGNAEGYADFVLREKKTLQDI